MTNRHVDNQGVTLIELLIVTTVLGTITMLAYPRMVITLEDSRLRSGAAKVTTAIEAAQLQSVHSGQRTRLLFDTTAESLHVERYSLPDAVFSGGDLLNETEVENGMFEPMEDPLNPGADYIRSLDDPLFFDGVDLTAAVFGSGSTLTFSALGAPQQGGLVTLTCGSRQTMISVDPLTGKVAVTH